MHDFVRISLLKNLIPSLSSPDGQGRVEISDVKKSRYLLESCFSKDGKEFSREEFPRTRPSARNPRFTKRSNCFPRDFSSGGLKRSERGHPLSLSLSLWKSKASIGRNINSIFRIALVFPPAFLFSLFFFFPLHAYNLRTYTRTYTRHVFAQLLINGATQSSKNRGTTVER